MGFLKSLLKDGDDDTWSSKRVVTFLAFVFCSIAFFANLFFDKKIDTNIFDGMMFIAIAGLGVTVTERFASRNKPVIYSEPSIIRHNRLGTPLPKREEPEL